MTCKPVPEEAMKASSIEAELERAARDFEAKRLDAAAARLGSVQDLPNLPAHLGARIEHALGVVAMETGRLARARRHLCHAVVAYRQLEDEPSYCRLLDDLGTVQMYQGRLAVARRTYRAALAHQQRLGDRTLAAQSLERLGQIEGRLGRVGPAVAYICRALALRVSGQDPNDRIADALDSLGVALRRADHSELSAPIHQISLSLRRQLDDELATAKTLTNLGVAYRKKGQLAEALACHQRAMAIRRRFSDGVGIANSHNNLGMVWFGLGRLRRARKHLRKALSFRNEIGDQVNAARNVANLRGVEEAAKRRNVERDSKIPDRTVGNGRSARPSAPT